MGIKALCRKVLTEHATASRGNSAGNSGDTGERVSSFPPIGVETQETRKLPAEIPFAVLMRSPDGSRYWIAPDGAEFDHGGHPVIRRSVFHAWRERGCDPEELKRIHQTVMTMGGDATEADSS